MPPESGPATDPNARPALPAFPALPASEATYGAAARVGAPADDLEAQVRAAEAAVAERDARIASKLRALEHQARGTLPRPRTAVLAATGAGAGAIAVLLFRRHRSNRDRNRSDGDRGSRLGWRRMREQPEVIQTGPSFPWAGLVPLMWPLLPSRWRARVSPATATALAGFIATRLGSRRKIRVRR